MQLLKAKYKAPFWGYCCLCALVQVADGLLSLLVLPFGLRSGLYDMYCTWDVKRMMREQKPPQSWYEEDMTGLYEVKSDADR